ncbi:MAG TPA: SRPBCC domain-containing protein [Jatrophihabitans sp.]|jgi:uncharacterized protein YndB with AHSA1/START domain|uniref:SRPBCC domain-containing protein n=1 Tax=Jatrophihabitans sp. TaxID=1932789 RepID=UPI002DFCFF24|nr:SRPBCC domain-containing protein [Jatrophihabitans sp.]
MDYASIERELYIDASPEVVFEVVSRPEHIRDWWSAETDVEPSPGSSGTLVWRDEATGREDTVPITVVHSDPPRVFSFRWAYAERGLEDALLVTFELTPSGTGTRLHLTETGFREQGWDAAVLEAQYNDHAQGWDFYVPRIATRAAHLVASR